MVRPAAWPEAIPAMDKTSVGQPAVMFWTTAANVALLQAGCAHMLPSQLLKGWIMEAFAPVVKTGTRAPILKQVDAAGSAATVVKAVMHCWLILGKCEQRKVRYEKKRCTIERQHKQRDWQQQQDETWWIVRGKTICLVRIGETQHCKFRFGKFGLQTPVEIASNNQFLVWCFAQRICIPLLIVYLYVGMSILR